MKKILIALLACLMALTVVACKDDSVDDGSNGETTPPAVTTTTPAPQNPSPQPPPTPKLGLHFSSIEGDGTIVSAQINNETKDIAVIVISPDYFCEEGAAVTVKLIAKNDADSKRTMKRASKIVNEFPDVFSIEYDLVDNTALTVGSKSEFHVTVRCLKPLEENQRVMIYVDLLELSANSEYVYVQVSGDIRTSGGIEEAGNGAFWTPPY